MGAYQQGSDPAIDDAIARWTAMIEFLRQHQMQRVTTADSIKQLRQLLDAPTAGAAETSETPSPDR